MTGQKDYGSIAEKIVNEILVRTYGKKNVKYVGKSNKYSGDFIVKDKKNSKIIEVKGQKVDNWGRSDDEFDSVGNYINLSSAEWHKLTDKKKGKQFQKSFEVWIVYRLDRRWKNWPVSIVKIKGTELVKCKTSPQPMIRVKTPRTFWKKIGFQEALDPKKFSKSLQKFLK